MQPHKTRAGGGGHIAPPVGTPPAWYFLPSAAESTQRTPPKPMVLDSLRGRGAVQSETHLPHESNNAYPRCAFASSLRLSPFESAYALALACRSQDPYSLLAFRRGRCLHRPAWICPALLAARHCEPVTDVTGVAIRISRPSGSPFKGSCHGKAVTEGSTRHFSRRASVGADAYIGPPRTGSRRISNLHPMHPAVRNVCLFQGGGDGFLLVHFRFPRKAAPGGDLPGHRDQPPGNAPFQTVFLRRHSSCRGVKGHHQTQFLLQHIRALQ